jgi:hypothetical protein
MGSACLGLVNSLLLRQDLAVAGDALEKQHLALEQYPLRLDNTIKADSMSTAHL